MIYTLFISEVSSSPQSREKPLEFNENFNLYEPAAPKTQRIRITRAHKERARRERNSNHSKPPNKNPATHRLLSKCAACKNIEGFVVMEKISDTIRIMVGKSHIVDKSEAVKIQQSRGVIETGLIPSFIAGAKCPEIDSEKWAIDYSYKRPWPALHKGIDIPRPRGTPIHAVADGIVVGKFLNERNRKGIEVMLRHSPKQTGLTFWAYSQYTHLREMSPLHIGQSIKIGQIIGKTSNTGKMGRRIRRDALHFAILYSKFPEWSNDGRFVTPKEGYWMDPNAFYRLQPPYSSSSLKTLPAEQKKILVPYIKLDGTFVPSNTKRIWPYSCD